jgi:perosamine synthetase
MSIKYPVYKPLLQGKERQYVLDCLNSTWISSKGKYISLFEEKFANYLGVKYAASVSNGTVALHLALLALGIGEGDEVIVPTLTYISCANSIAYSNAKPVFVDSLAKTWQISPEDVEKKITKRTKAIMAVHLYGHPCDIDSLKRICKNHNLFLIEDCAEAIGSKYRNKSVGTFGDVATFSFYGNKTITTGEGGMVVTNNKSTDERLRHLKGQGLAKNREYWHDVVGYNYRMTNICAAIGLAQLENIQKITTKKREIAQWYSEEFKDSDIVFHDEASEVLHSYWMVSILIKRHRQRDALRKYLMNFGIETRPVFYPIHKMPMYLKKDAKFSIAEDIGGRGINLPSYPELTRKDVKFISKKIKNFFSV